MLPILRIEQPYYKRRITESQYIFQFYMDKKELPVEIHHHAQIDGRPIVW
jgi:hypothetical protein